MRLKKWIALFCLCMQCTGICCAENSESIYEQVLAYELVQSGKEDVQAWIDGPMSEKAGVSSEWYALGLCALGNYDLSEYAAGLMRYLQENTVRSHVTKQKYALLLLASGGSPETAREILASSIGQQGLMSWVYGLHLMNNGMTCDAYTALDAVKKILSFQLGDGGWVITGKVSDPDVTAMVLQALAPYYTHNSDVTDAAGRALLRLSEMQLQDGGYASYGKANAESAAQVWLALSALGINAAKDPRFIKNGNSIPDALEAFRLADGSYSHVPGAQANSTATQQVFLASAAAKLLQQEKGNVFLIPAASKPIQIRNTKQLGWRTAAAGGIIAAALTASAVLMLLKKKSAKNYLFVWALSAALIAAVCTVEIHSADEYYQAAAPEKKTVGAVTLSIRCDTVAGRKAHIPHDGIILENTVLVLGEGETAYDLLVTAARTHQIHMESSGAPGMRYIAGIANLYEYDFGDLSGWIYYLNGEALSEGCDSRSLRDGDRVDWLYSCELGNDLK